MAEYISFQPSDFYNTKLFTGTGASNALTGVGFQPDFAWIKNRDAADFHVLTDAVRGVTKYLQSNDAAAEVTNAESLKTFDSDGFTVGTMNEVNTNTEDYVSWNWKMGTTTGIDTTSSTITPPGYSFNATAGQSVIAYTGNGVAGAKVPHGLGAVPQFFSIHRVDSTSAWDVFHHQQHTTTPAGYYLDWTSTAAAAVNSSRFNDTAPDAVNFTIGDSGYVNENTGTYIAYCWTPKKGYSKFGGYRGNGNADGPFIYTGFRPGFIMIKRIDSTGAWQVWDSKRPTYNETTGRLYPNDVDAESNTQELDILSNGFKYRDTGAAANASSATYIYMAFAAFPTVSSNDIPGVAR